jgi:hypothetical protein
MTFLVDEDLPRSVGAVLREFGHEVVDVRDIGLRGAPIPKLPFMPKLISFAFSLRMEALPTFVITRLRNIRVW